MKPEDPQRLLPLRRGQGSLCPSLSGETHGTGQGPEPGGGAQRGPGYRVLPVADPELLAAAVPPTPTITKANRCPGSFTGTLRLPASAFSPSQDLPQAVTEPLTPSTSSEVSPRSHSCPSAGEDWPHLGPVPFQDLPGTCAEAALMSPQPPQERPGNELRGERCMSPPGFCSTLGILGSREPPQQTPLGSPALSGSV